MPDASVHDRGLAALYGLAIGDALGMPTQLLSRRQVRDRYGAITGFVAAAPDHPLAAGLPAGSVTDDDEQALLVAEVLLHGRGHVDPSLLARRLTFWEDEMRARGSLDLLGPSTRAAVAAVLAGTPVEEAGRNGTTNGAAMRVTPVGLVVPANDLVRLVDRVTEACLVSHHTGVAIAGASAVAAAVSAGLSGASVAEATTVAVEAARLGAQRGHWVAGGSVAGRIAWAVEMADTADPDGSVAAIADLVGTSLATQESVPTAFGVLAAHPDDAWAAVCAAAGLGGDSDTIAAMVGAVAGACGGSFPQAARDTVARVNGLHLEAVADELLAWRGRP